MSYFKTYKCPQCKKGDLIPAYKTITVKGKEHMQHDCTFCTKTEYIEREVRTNVK